MVLGVQPSRILALVHGALAAGDVGAPHVYCMPWCASLPRTQSRLDEGRPMLTPDRAESLALNDQPGIAADVEVY